jgi:hypothetical protein
VRQLPDLLRAQLLGNVLNSLKQFQSFILNYYYAIKGFQLGKTLLPGTFLRKILATL